VVDGLRAVANRADRDNAIDRLDDTARPHRAEAAAQLDQLDAVGNQRAGNLDALLRTLDADRDAATGCRADLDPITHGIAAGAGVDEAPETESHEGMASTHDGGAPRARTRGSAGGRMHGQRWAASMTAASHRRSSRFSTVPATPMLFSSSHSADSFR